MSELNMPQIEMPKLTKKQQLAKEYKRIKRQLKYLENKNIIVSDIKLPKTLKGAQNLTLEKIKRKAKYIDPETGELLTYKQTQTKKYKSKYIQSTTSKLKRKSTQPKKQKAVESSQYEENVNTYYPALSDITYENFVYLLNKLEYGDPTYYMSQTGKIKKRQDSVIEAAMSAIDRIKTALNNEITKYGQNTIMYRIETHANSGELKTLLDYIYNGYDSDDQTVISKISLSTQLIIEIIKNKMLSTEETEFYSDYDNFNEEL